MQYYENKHGEIIGRLYEAGSGFAAEIGRMAEKSSFGFFATKGVRFRTRKQAEKFLLENGCFPAIA